MRKDLNKKLGKSVPCGGNTFTTAMSTAAVVFGTRIFVLVGSELCYDNQYYVDKKSHWDNTDEMRWKVIDVNGKDRWTNIPLFQYKIWIEKMAKDLPQCQFIDTSFGIVGTDCEYISVMDLSDAIRKVNYAFDVSEKKDWHEFEKMRYDAAYATMKYIPTQGLSIWNSLFELNDIGGIKTVLDVGCGIGQCVADGRNRGLTCHGIDITEKAKWFWDEANISKFCDVAPADKIPFPDKSFDLVFCTEVLEHIPEEGIFDSFTEMYRVGKGDFVFSIALSEAVNKMPNDGSEPHICVKPPEWWFAQIERAKYKICGIKHTKEANSLIIIATRSDHNDKDLLRNGCLHIQPKRYMQLSRNNLSVANGG
jgi:SAM-dependent methyltransferase